MVKTLKEIIYGSKKKNFVKEVMAKK